MQPYLSFLMSTGATVVVCSLQCTCMYITYLLGVENKTYKFQISICLCYVLRVKVHFNSLKCVLPESYIAPFRTPGYHRDTCGVSITS